MQKIELYWEQKWISHILKGMKLAQIVQFQENPIGELMKLSFEKQKNTHKQESQHN